MLRAEEWGDPSACSRVCSSLKYNVAAACETSQTSVVASPPTLQNLQCHLLTKGTTAGRCWNAAALSQYLRLLAGAQAWCGTYMGSGMMAGLTWQLPVLRINPERACSLPEAEYCWSLPEAQLDSLAEFTLWTFLQE